MMEDNNLIFVILIIVLIISIIFVVSNYISKSKRLCKRLCKRLLQKNYYNEDFTNKNIKMQPNTTQHNRIKSTLIKGYYVMTWNIQPPPPGDYDFGIWFSGETALSVITNRLDEASYITSGKKILNIGGGNTSGIWSGNSVSYPSGSSISTSSVLYKSDLDVINKNITNIKSNGWDGICFDIEVCAAGVELKQEFLDCFKYCKQAGLIVIVTTSGITPYSCTSNGNLVNSWIGCSDIDYISPQLYGADGVKLVITDLSLFASIPSKILTTIPYESDWSKLNIDNIKINPSGYLTWNIGLPKPVSNYCSSKWDLVSCSNIPCPNGLDSECPALQSCFANVDCSKPTISRNTTSSITKPSKKSSNHTTLIIIISIVVVLILGILGIIGFIMFK
jgi:hypothetical protein